jgi:hypothetical protein
MEATMDDEKEEKSAIQAATGDTKQDDEKPSISQGVSGLISSTVSAITESVRGAASSIAEIAKTTPTVSRREETAHPPVAENFDAPPMTADEIAREAAADVQPVATANKARRKKTASAKKATPRKAAKKIAKKKIAKTAKKSRKAAAKKSTKKSAKKSASKAKNTKRATGNHVSKKAPKKNSGKTKR